MVITLDDIKNDNISSSSQLSQSVLELLIHTIKNLKEVNVKKFAEKINNIGNVIIKSQPDMVVIRKNITYIIYYMNRMVKSGKSLEYIVKHLEIKIKNIVDDFKQKREKIASIGAKLVFNNNNIITISYSSMIKDILITARKLKRKFSVYCLESRPMKEGIKLAEDLTKNSIKCYLITDASMGKMMKNMNMVMCGADRLYESGFVNKIGTLPMAITAKYFSIPFYVASETDKILKEIDRSLRFYRQNEEEIYDREKVNAEAINYYFEAIPYDLVAKIICDDGIFAINEFINWYIKV